MQRLLPSQEADLGKTLALSGLPGSEFELASVDGGFAGYVSPRDTPGIVHKPTGYWFGIARRLEDQWGTGRPVDTGFQIACAPGTETEIHEAGPLTWKGVLAEVAGWIKNLLRELNAPDFQEVLASLADDARAAPEAGSAELEEQLSPDERAHVETAIDSVLEELRAVKGLQAEEFAYIRSELMELKSDLATMNRGKWRKVAVGTLAQMVLDRAVQPEFARLMFDRIQAAFRAASAVLPPGMLS